MSYRPKYLAHVNVYVRDVVHSHKWYEDLLGLHTYDYRPGAAASMSANEDESHEIALMQVGENAPLQAPGQVGLNHMAWRVESLDDLKEFYHRLKAKKVPVTRIADHGISLGIYFRDPDGNGIEVPAALSGVSSQTSLRKRVTLAGEGVFPATTRRSNVIEHLIDTRIPSFIGAPALAATATRNASPVMCRRRPI
jgi:catechol 2,3-dioxygenase-like lactoylglutathione lyase family enzyme